MILRRFYKVIDRGFTKYFSLTDLQTVWQQDKLKTVDGVDHADVVLETASASYQLSVPADQVSSLFQDIESKLNDLDNFKRTGIWPKLK